MTQMQVLLDGNLLISGYSKLRSQLIKLTPSGEIIWHRTHTPFPLQPENFGFHEYTHILHSLPTSDGGFLCTGSFRSDPRDEYPNGIQTAIALKVDEYGCLEAGCEVTGIEELHIEKDEGQLRLFPNPANDFVTVDYRIDKAFNQGEMRISNQLGQVLMRKPIRKEQDQVIVRHGLEPGFYLLELNIDGISYRSSSIVIQ